MAVRLNLEREPNSLSFESKRLKGAQSITKSTLFVGKDASSQVEKHKSQDDVVQVLASSVTTGQAICRIFKGDDEDWRLECLNGEVFRRLKPLDCFQLKDGMCLRFGSASVVRILREGPGLGQDESSSSAFPV